MTKKQQYNEYVNNGGTMSLDEWLQDGRYDPSFAKRAPGAGAKPHPVKGRAFTTSIRLYPCDKKYLIKVYGSLQVAINTLISDPLPPEYYE